MPPTNEEALFALALGKPPSERSAWLDRECGVDRALRARLDALLEAHEQPDGLLADPTEVTCSTVPCELKEAPEAVVGMTLGRYKLREKLGEGGCGTVYVAEQTEPVRRRVALKVIKLGMDTKQVVARFEAERQALAMMDHPNIAKVLDAGTTEAGRPYFVMELVRGMRITEYCDQANLSTRERLDLFIKVCQAIQHAHQKGIIHRDIKPSNILVTLHDGVPVPKVIDFGIAKATEGRLTDNTVYTQLHQFIGTPAYMSPEQAEMSGLDIDTRSDIYSLGVLLYELLAGSTPFDAKELVASGIDAMRKTIREKEPMRPSTRLAALGPEELTTTAKRRSADTSKLLHQLKGDLDWIVMKCLEKDRQRRYETANGLSADIRRHLDNEPVTARPPSAAYRFQKAFRRNKVLFGAIGAVACALLVGVIVSSWQALRATRASRSELRQRQVAEAARAEAQTKQREAEAARSRAQQEQQRADDQARRAVENQEHSRRLLYAADMNLVHQSLNKHNLGRARQLLDRHRPKAGEEELRGWEWRYLWQQSRGDALAVLSKRQNARCTSVSFSPDGRLLALGHSDGRIELWDVTRRVLLRELSVDGPWARVVFSPVSNVLAATAGEGTIKLHDIDSGRETILWQTQRALIKRLTATPDGSRLVAFITGPPGTSVVTFDMLRGVPVSTNSATRGDGEGGMLGVTRLSSDKKRLFVGGAAESGRRVVLKCLDTETDREIWQTEVGVDVGMTAMALSPDDKVLVTGTGYQAGVMSVLDARTGKLITRLDAHNSWVTDLTFSRDGAWLAAAASESIIRLWNTSSWKEPRILRGNGDNVLSVEFSPDGRMLASGAKDGSALLWDIAPRPSRYGHRLLPSQVTFVREITPGLAFATLDSGEGSEGESKLLRLDELELLPLGIESRKSPFFVPPNLISFYDRTNTLEFFEIGKSGLDPLGAVSVATNMITAGGAGGTRVPTLVYHPGQRLVAWGEVSNLVTVVSLGQPGRRWRWVSDFQLPNLRAFSPDGELLVVSKPSPAQEFELREVKTGKQILRWNIAKTQPRVLFGSPTRTLFADGGRRFVAAGTDSNGMQVLFWDLAQPEKPPIRFSERGIMRVLSVSPDGRWVAAGNDAGQLMIYDAVKLERLPEYLPSQSTVQSATFSPDSRSVATGFQGLEAFKLWQMGTAQELLTFPGLGLPLDRIEFAENGNTLIVGNAGSRGTWQMWRAPSWEVIQAAEAQALLTPGSATAGGEGSRQP